MQFKRSVLLLLGFLIATSLALPASRTDEVELVPPKSTNTYGDQLLDTGFLGGWENPIGNPFNGFFDGFESMMTRMRQQIQDLLEKFPPLTNGNSTEGIEVPLFPAFGGIDLDKGNTTSETKIIDGHKVVINTTEYKKEDNFGGAYFKVKVIDVKPDSSEITTEKEAESVEPNNIVKDKESIENTIENEIPTSNAVGGNIENSPEKLRVAKKA